MPQLILRSVIVDREPYVVFLHKFLDTRQGGRVRISSDNHRDSRSLGIFELTADVVILVLGKVNRPHGMQLNTGGVIVVERLRLLRRTHREMVFYLLRVQRRYVELLHVADQLRAVEIARGVAAQTQIDWRPRAT